MAAQRGGELLEAHNIFSAFHPILCHIENGKSNFPVESHVHAHTNYSDCHERRNVAFFSPYMCHLLGLLFFASFSAHHSTPLFAFWPRCNHYIILCCLVHYFITFCASHRHRCCITHSPMFAGYFSMTRVVVLLGRALVRVASSQVCC